jgi:hypothetical protein
VSVQGPSRSYEDSETSRKTALRNGHTGKTDQNMGDLYPLITRDPVSGGELIVTRLECPASGIVIEGRFSLAWIGRLTVEQLEFAGLLVRHRGNVQKVAAELGVAYNTARNRLDDIVAALGGPAEGEERPDRPDRLEVLNRLAAGEIDFAEAMRLLKG